jgi:hypothetical protein
MAEECLESVNERTSSVVVVNFLDEDKAPVTPDSATYRIDDRESKIAILAATAISPLSSTVSLQITSDQNQIYKARKAYEIRTVTVEWDYTSASGPKHGTAEYRYKVLSLYGVQPVASPSTSPSASASPSV